MLCSGSCSFLLYQTFMRSMHTSTTHWYEVLLYTDVCIRNRRWLNDSQLLLISDNKIDVWSGRRLFLSILWFASSSTTIKKTACESAASLGLIVFQFNSHILQWFYGVINSRNKGDASSDSIKESRQWVAGDVVVISSLLFWCLICIHWNWWILVVSNRGGFGLKVWCN